MEVLEVPEVLEAPEAPEVWEEQDLRVRAHVRDDVYDDGDGDDVCVYVHTFSSISYILNLVCIVAAHLSCLFLHTELNYF
jgi:hypothetical protein